MGETVAVLGFGPVGRCAVQTAKLAGARVIAIDSVQRRLTMAASFGAIFDRREALKIALTP